MESEKIIISAIKKLTKTKFNKETFIRDLNIDSLDLVILVSDLEEAYNIKISDEELLSLKTINDIIELFDKKTNK
ncbi:acyl carrier protein [Metamycoplasma hominis]|uniref:acyl carrier protein n=1 Tax=Metamycoplasma hominis TaxID=2098 RepID=UPI000DDF943F|nr:phosphopantetheine-binding protein [Metamycoplasma hominis]MDU7418572.1 phosphopantetheine-binding protein [Metamycoplasma hominis]RBI35447.1 acyl carrier protein [Metamycoplasma hominis]